MLPCARAYKTVSETAVKSNPAFCLGASYRENSDMVILFFLPSSESTVNGEPIYQNLPAHMAAAATDEGGDVSEAGLQLQQQLSTTTGSNKLLQEGTLSYQKAAAPLPVEDTTTVPGRLLGSLPFVSLKSTVVPGFSALCPSP